MSIKEEMPTVDSPREEMSLSLRLKSLSVRWKIRIAYWVGILLTACLVIIMVNIFQRRAAIHHAYDKVYLLRSVKTKLAEAWFERLADKIASLTADQKTVDMQGQLTESFLNIENDNYSTPGAETPEKINALVEGFYNTEVIPVLENRMDKKIPLNSVLPADQKQQIMQYLYMAANTKPFGSKLGINKASDGSSYSSLHAQFQPEMVKYARETGISDIFLVDYKTGYVVYSMQKNPDFATNLFDGPYHNSGLGLAFKAAIGLPAGSFQITDESLYAGQLLQPALFISAPLFVGSEIKGAVVFEVDASLLDRILAMNKDDEAGIPGLKSFFVGPDLLYRNNDPSLVQESQRYVRRLKRWADNGRAYSLVEKLKTTAMVQQVNSVAFADGLSGKERQKEYRTETGEDVFSSFGPIAVPGLNWLIVSQLDKSQALKPVSRLTGYLIIISLVLAFLAYIIVHILSDKLADRLSVLGGFLHTGIHAGKDTVKLETAGDEIETAVSAAQMLKTRIYEASKYTDQLGEGNLDGDISFDGEDKLGQSLHNLKNVLISRREQEETRVREDEIRNWSTHGVALFNDILRMDNNNLEKLCLNIIRNIIQYLSANQGGIFLIDKEEESTWLDLVAAYAFDRQKFLKKRIGIGEGLAGTCALEKKTILLSRIPQDYMEITSGLGGAKPSCLLIVPLKKDEDVLGVMEIASFNAFKPHEVEFVEKVAESIASALITVRLHLQTSQYLERFQQQAEEMKAQDEELRQNIEELQATHEQMERMKAEEDARNKLMIKEIEDNRKMLLKVLDQIPGKIFLKDHNGTLLLLNTAVAKVYSKTVEELIGTNDFDNHTFEDATEYRKKELEIIANGAETYIQEETVTGEKKYLKTTKMPFFIPHLNKVGLLGIQLDVTDFMNIEMENREKEKELNLSKKLLIDILDKIPAKIFLKDEKGVFVAVNSSVASVYNKKADQVIGTSDYDNHPDEDVDSWRKQEIEIMEKGETNYLHTETIGGVTRHLNTIKMPFMIATTAKKGLLGIQFDVTELKEKEHETLKMAELIKEKEREIAELKKGRGTSE
jgi:PAS domain S-box-containing protein